ncbi:hypothetical protein PGT21_009708 [Puccinia graminis f. sp. tritici]|uniref:Uncharacterized protein n=1 Tax=Puccinia graminis f. sp. tritici TaxID=56615 RepID=A0A5B0MF87_PUCGR|nr:hypothetical protein PGT21_009708 [Puccinia graminis f. sp. tritici]
MTVRAASHWVVAYMGRFNRCKVIYKHFKHHLCKPCRWIVRRPGEFRNRVKPRWLPSSRHIVVQPSDSSNQSLRSSPHVLFARVADDLPIVMTDSSRRAHQKKHVTSAVDRVASIGFGQYIVLGVAPGDSAEGGYHPDPRWETDQVNLAAKLRGKDLR